jgi:hypothetical protein
MPKDKKKEDRPDMLATLGIDIGDEDKEYFFLAMIDVAMSPKSIYNRLRVMPELLDRAVPDTNLTRKRIARLLLGFELLFYAARKMVEAENIDILMELKTLLREAVDDSLPETGEITEEDLEGFKKCLTEKAEELGNRIKSSGDPDISEAVDILTSLPPIFDLEKEQFDFIAVKDFDIKSLGEGKAPTRREAKKKT